MSWRTEGALPCMFKQICSEDKGRLKAREPGASTCRGGTTGMALGTLINCFTDEESHPNSLVTFLIKVCSMGKK